MMESQQLPLSGRRILVTAPLIYAARLAPEIILKGGLPLLMPTIETCGLDDFSELDRIIQKLDSFDWIAFTSRNGIEGFCQRWELLSPDRIAAQNLSICAIGADAQKLIDRGYQVDLIPSEPSPVGIIQELAKIPNIAGQKILVPVPLVLGVPEPDVVPQFIAGLIDLGMEVTRINTYQTRSIQGNIYNVELELIHQGKINAIAFSSTAEIAAFLQMFPLPPSCKIACFGPYTAANAKKLGLSVDIIASDFSSFAGFANALSESFSGYI